MLTPGLNNYGLRPAMNEYSFGHNGVCLEYIMDDEKIKGFKFYGFEALKVE